MWGDPNRALHLDDSDALSMLLFQVASPAHLSQDDSRWQELLHGYDVWVHVEVRDDDDGVLYQACQSMSKHAANSSNLAALGRLTCQLLEELHPAAANGNNQTKQKKQVDQVAAFSERIAIVGKARAAAGALQLLRIFTHRILVDYGNLPSTLSEIFTYRNRDSNKDTNVAEELVNALFQFLTGDGAATLIRDVPEMYDTCILALELLLVMLSTQLYQPMVSSMYQAKHPESRQCDFFLDLIMDQARHAQAQEQRRNQHGSQGSLTSNDNDSNILWTPKSILSACLKWQMQRPASPARSIARYHYSLAQSVAAAKGEQVGPDGMYESNLVVSAAAPQKSKQGLDSGNLGDSSTSLLTSQVGSRNHHSFLLDATKGVLVQASTIIMLPFRLVRLALGLWGHHKQDGFDDSRKRHYNSAASLGQSRTRDVLWVTESPVADLASALFLLLANNRRVLINGGQIQQSVAGDDDGEKPLEGNPFQIELSALSDNRWESGHDSSGLPDLPDPVSRPAELNESMSLLGALDREQQEDLPGAMSVHSRKHGLMLNFETLFLTYGNILHTEVGALSIYTLLQSSKLFAETIAVRSDLDTLVIPLLRTLYLSASARHVSALDFQAKSTQTETTSTGLYQVNIRTCPFRSQSQLYLVVILLLLFSQDTSFGSDVFRRTMVSSVPWYKERYLKDISLGSVMLLTLLRSLTFNLNRLHDMFLLSNCCAVLMNLSHSVVDLHEYAAMRLAAVAVSCMKKYSAMTLEESKKERDDEENPLLDMYSEVSRALLRLIKHALAQNTIDRNLHLVYALMYHQADFKKLFAMKHSPFKKAEINRIQGVIKASAKIIESNVNARTAPKALQLLTENMDQIQASVADKKKKNTDKEDFRFSYEEEADPENFFVPYIWEVVVCVVSASSVEWHKNEIQVFPLLEVEETPSDVADAATEENGATGVFAQDLTDVV